mgnify:CR=1 FL=1
MKKGIVNSPACQGKTRCEKLGRSADEVVLVCVTKEATPEQMAQALKAGATKEEIAEALRVAFHLSGVGCLYAASFGLKDLLE